MAAAVGGGQGGSEREQSRSFFMDSLYILGNFPVLGISSIGRVESKPGTGRLAWTAAHVFRDQSAPPRGKPARGCWPRGLVRGVSPGQQLPPTPVLHRLGWGVLTLASLGLMMP